MEIGKVVVEVVDKRDLHQLKDIENYLINRRYISCKFNSRCDFVGHILLPKKFVDDSARDECK